MRILHLPVNIASIQSHTVRGLQKNDVETYGLVFTDSPVQSADGLKVIELTSSRRPLPWIGRSIKWLYHYFKWVSWADVIHWYYGSPALPFDIDLKYIKALGKPAVVEWFGSDIRIPEVEYEDNPYYKAAFQNGYEYSFESLKRSRKIQKRFAEAGFASMGSIAMLSYVQKDIFHFSYIVPQRLFVSDYYPSYPDPSTIRPLIIHAPTAPVAKGTLAVLKAIERLKDKYKIEFKLVQGLNRYEALQLMQKADIFLDQFVLGHHGMAALEAMALGKPTLCYIKPSVVNQYPPDLPILIANQDNLADVLEPLLKDGELRNKIGQRSRAYVEKYHDAVKLTKHLTDIYQTLTRDKEQR